jgi:hypothetical protein
MLKKIGIGVAVLIVGFVVLVMLQPSTFRIERSKSIAAPSWVVFNIVNNFHRWPAWSPWEKLDPNMEKKHSGPEAGVGAVYEWTGNKDVGTGRMTITESAPPEKLTIDLEFMEPWEAKNTTLFSFEGKAKETNVTWAMEGENTFMGKAMSLFMDMDAMVGKDFEAGLDELDKLAVAEAAELEKKKAEELAADEKAVEAAEAAMAEGAPEAAEEAQKQ